MTPFQQILAATDLSDASIPAFEEAVRIALDSGARLFVAHVYPLPESPALAGLSPGLSAGLSAGLYEDLDKAVRADAQERVQALVDRAREKGVDARPAVLMGLPDVEIVAAAIREKADLIVMGTHGRRGVARFLLGSVASRVVASAPCPVMTVRQRATPSGESADGD